MSLGIFLNKYRTHGTSRETIRK